MKSRPYKTDQEWIRALKGGEIEAWGAVPNEEAGITAGGLLGLVYKWARWETHDVDQAKDIAIETGSRVLRHLEGFRGEVRFEKWLRLVYRSVLLKRAPAFQYKLRSKLERWLRTADRRGLEQRRATERAIGRLRPDERQVMELVKQGQKTEELATTLGLSQPLVRALKNQGMSAFLDNHEFMAMLVRVGNQYGAKKDKLAANIVAAHRELQEIPVEELLKPERAEGDELNVWDVLPHPASTLEKAEAELSERLTLFWECVDRLPQAKKEIIQLTWRYRLHGANSGNVDEQIAQELAIQPRLVRLRRFQARTPLKRCMEEAE